MWPFGKSKTDTIIESLPAIIDQKIQQLDNVYEVKLGEVLQIQEKAYQGKLDVMLRNFSTQIFPQYNSVKEQKAFSTSPNLFSVVSRIAADAANIPLCPRMADGSDVPENDKVYDFLKTLSLEQFIEAYTYLLLFGEIFGYKEKIPYGVNAGLQRMVIFHPLQVDIIISDVFPLTIVGFTYRDNINGETIFIDVEDMIFVKIFNPDVDTLRRFRGLAPVGVLKKILEREDSGIDISVAQQQNGGNPSIVFDETPGVMQGNTGNVDVVGARRDNYARFISNKANKGAPFFAAGKMGSISVGSTVADLDLIKLSEANLDIVCNVYGVSSTDFNNKSASTESNVKVHSKSYYTHGVLPYVRLFRDGLNRQAMPDIKTKSELYEDISDIPELQPDYKSIADALGAAPVFIPNNVLRKMGEPEIADDENMNKVFIKNGYTLLEDAVMPVEDIIPNVADDYAAPVVPIKQMVK